MNRILHKLVKLSLRLQNCWASWSGQLLDNDMALLLILKGNSRILQQVVSMSDGLVARCNLVVSVSVKVYAPIQTVHVAVNSCIQVFAVLVHQAEIQVNRGKVRVVVTTDHLQDL